MRTSSITLFILLGLLVAGSVEAQTWESPYILWPNGPASSNTCAASNTIFDIDSNPADGPEEVYHFLTLVHPRGFGGGGQPPTPEYLTLYPDNWYSSVDFEVFVCEYKNGYDVWNCPIEADNMYNIGSAIQITIPPEDLTYHIIVTSGMLNDYYDYGHGCGAYTLITSH